ncbi:CHAT domain-containing protein [Lusitaniella coriacea LEGE 07157]|uniref:CHAT domain-containing protein n=1 Tax=Lusitaniella coriacea LEGE 07157 TaxID=945747 RepID=A0A8J7DUV4_9CYAN|nr:CHAT domain-containing protein [Lusitaniella coriacea]MBE9114680.1 CHAT domain-containing protein [Lusitaniella coriacea LEGE 07157]
MDKLVILDFDGDLQQGVTVTLEISVEEGNRAIAQTRLKGKLPPYPQLIELYQNWQSLYYHLGGVFRIEERFKAVTYSSEKALIQDCNKAAKILSEQLNEWLKKESFRPIREKLLEKILPDELTRVILQVEDTILRKLPWHLWDFFERYPKAELALGATAYERPKLEKSSRKKARILAILGHRAGIDIAADRKLLTQFIKDAEIEFLLEPKRQELYQHLWDVEGWDLLFFAGHSSSQGDGKQGTIEINPHDRLSLGELTHALKKAVEHGLKIAIFNSCDGLGLARELEKLHIPQTIVMREPIPDVVAQEFLKYFLTAFCRGTSLYLAVREAREQLQSLENYCPGATWLPVICQNPLEIPLSWQQICSPQQNFLERKTKTVLTKIPPCPYRGLSAFSPQDAPFFFGREVATKKLLESIPEKPLIPVIGASGSGKSSLVFAGLIPKLNHCAVAVFRPGNRPFFKLAESLISLLEPDLRETERLVETNKLTIALEQGDLTLGNIVDRALQKNPAQTHFLLVADQFEELYTLNPTKSGLETPAIAFLDLLLEAIARASHFTLILTLRADFFEYALSYRPFAEALCQYSPELLGPMNRQELQRAIEQPAALLNVDIAEGLSERILEAVEAEPGNLPLLEFALTLLWERLERGCLTHAAYDEIGGVKRALADYAEQIYRQLSPAERKKARRIFTQLVRPGEGTADTRRVAQRGELGEDCAALVKRLADARLVVISYQMEDGERIKGKGKIRHQSSVNREQYISTSPASQSPHYPVTPSPVQTDRETVEIVHEALIQEWQRLRQWLNDDRAFRTGQERIRQAMGQWESGQNDEGFLLHGTPLLEAQRWLQERPKDLSDRERAYIQASLALKQQEQRVQMSLRRKVAIALSVALVGSLSLAGLAAWQWQRAQVNEMGSLLNSLSDSSEELFASNKDLDALIESINAAQKLRRSQKTKPDTRVRVITALHQAVYGIREYNRLEGHEHSVLAVRFSPDDKFLASASDDDTIKIWQRNGKEITTLKGHRDRVRSVSWSADGNLLASGSYDGTVKIWQRDGILLATLKTGAKVNAVEYSPNGQHLAAATADGTLWIWQRDGTLQNSWKAHRSWIMDVSWSSDGRLIASGSTDKTIKLWQFTNEETTPPLQDILSDHQGSVNSVKFSPDNRLLVSAGNDNTVKLWQLDGTLLNTLNGHRDRVWEITWSPDSQSFATASQDKTIEIWDKDGTLSATLKGHNSSVYSVSWSADGQTLATASADTTIKLWHPQSNKLTTLAGHGAEIRDVAFSPDGKRLITTSVNGTLKLWEQNDSQSWQNTSTLTLKPEDAVGKLHFSPDNKTLITASIEGGVKLWHIEDNKTLKPRKTLTHRMAIWGMGVSPSGKTIATTSNKNTLDLWHLDGKHLQTLREQGFSAIGVSFSPDGQLLAAGSDDDTVRIWVRNRAGTFDPLPPLTGHTSGVWDVTWSPDSQILASASIDGTIKLWRRDRSNRFNPRPYKTLKGHLNRVNSVSFSPKGKLLASGSADGTIKLWSLNGTLLKTLKGHRGGVWAVRFSPNGKLIASTSDDQTAILWNLNPNILLEQGCEWIEDYLQTNPNLTESDRGLCNS